MDADCYIAHISRACKAMNGMSLTAFGWLCILWHILSSKYAAGCACSVSFIEDILKCVVNTDLCFKTT